MSELTKTNAEINQSEILIEKAIPSDAEAIVDIQRTTWLATYPNEELGITREDILKKLVGNSSELVGERVKRWGKIIESAGEQSQVFVARHEGKVIGYVAPGRMGGQDRLGALYVLPGAQNNGVGSQLMRTALDWYGPDKEIHLHVASYNARAIAFYEKFGFRGAGEVKSEPEQLGSGKSIPEIEMVRPAQ